MSSLVWNLLFNTVVKAVLYLMGSSCYAKDLREMKKARTGWSLDCPCCRRLLELM